ncbi:MAG TPA: serine/threonine-protein kinase, partial [Gemmatimonadales bacterium]|nr:serine/threonine-protein kinase [Gemmatimonadales bacterium]
MAESSTPSELRVALSRRFTIRREIGRGGMGVVLQAHDRELDRDVAIKLLTPSFSQALGAERFNREIRLTANLVHPNIVPLFDSGEAAGHLYYVMPLIDGDTLRSRLERQGPLPAAEVVRVIADLAEALAYAHTAGVIHRDIKPENVFWYRQRALLSDFGIATAQIPPTGKRLTATGMVVGTLDYLSPEQAEAEGALDGRADLYSLGCMAYELLGGHPPYITRSPVAALAAHLTAPVPDIRSTRPDVPELLAILLTELMAKRAEERPPSATALLDRLRAVDLGAHPASAPAPAAPLRRGSPQALELYDRGLDFY